MNLQKRQNWFFYSNNNNKLSRVKPTVCKPTVLLNFININCTSEAEGQSPF